VVQEPGRVQRGSGEGSEGSGEGLEGFGAEPGQVQHGSAKVSGAGSRKAWCKAKSVSTASVEGSGQGLGSFGAEKVPKKVWEALAQSLVRFNRVSEKVPEKVLAKVWEAALVQSHIRFNRVPEKVPVQQGSGEGSGEGCGEGLGGFGAEPGQVQQGSGEGSGEGSRKPWCKARSGSTGFRGRFRRRSGRLCSHAEVFPALGFAACFRKRGKNLTSRLLGSDPRER